MGAIVNFSHLLLIFSLLITTRSNAEQLSFTKKDLGDQIQFNYQWLDHKKQQQTLDFSLPKSAVFDRFRQFKLYKSEFSEAYVHKELQGYLQKQPLTGVKVTFSKKSGHSQVTVKGKKNADVNSAYNEITKLQQKFFQQYLNKNNYQRFVTYNGINAIKPNHVAISAQSVNDVRIFKKLVLEKVTVENIRKVTNFVLNFIQSIPYSTLESRATSSGAGFNPPLQLLYQNQGDCDSKVTLTAAILRALMPRINMIIVYIEQHALIGIEMRAAANDMTITAQGITYILAEPTGPALAILGKVSPPSERAILANLYSTEKFK
jgi:hypothetical protein